MEFGQSRRQGSLAWEVSHRDPPPPVSAALTSVLEDIVHVQGHPGEHMVHRRDALGIHRLRLHVKPAGSGEQTGAEPAPDGRPPGSPWQRPPWLSPPEALGAEEQRLSCAAGQQPGDLGHLWAQAQFVQTPWTQQRRACVHPHLAPCRGKGVKVMTTWGSCRAFSWSSVPQSL